MTAKQIPLPILWGHGLVYWHLPAGVVIIQPANGITADYPVNRTDHPDQSRANPQNQPDLPTGTGKLKSSINHLLDSEQQQRSRYKNSLSDLAHSLKTPLAVLSGTDNMPASTKEPLLQLDNIIQRQLKGRWPAVVVVGSRLSPSLR